jgi:hypothetical protein
MFITFAVLLGIIGLLYHAEKDLKSFMFWWFYSFYWVCFENLFERTTLWTKREDYALVGLFYVFAIWIGFEVYALYEILQKYLAPKSPDL